MELLCLIMSFQSKENFLSGGDRCVCVAQIQQSENTAAVSITASRRSSVHRCDNGKEKTGSLFPPRSSFHPRPRWTNCWTQEGGWNLWRHCAGSLFKTSRWLNLQRSISAWLDCLFWLFQLFLTWIALILSHSFNVWPLLCATARPWSLIRFIVMQSFLPPLILLIKTGWYSAHRKHSHLCPSCKSNI